jgi:hypothetical protein
MALGRQYLETLGRPGAKRMKTQRGMPHSSTHTEVSFSS